MKLLSIFAALVHIHFAMTAVSSSPGICQRIKNRLVCGGNVIESSQDNFDTVIEDSEEPSLKNDDDLADTDENPFAIETGDKRFFTEQITYILCDKFQNWKGYSLSEIQSNAKKLKITEDLNLVNLTSM